MTKVLHDDRIRLRQERPFITAVRREKNRFTRAANESYKVYGQVSDRVFEQHQENMRALFTERYKRVVRAFVRDMRRFKSVDCMLETKQTEQEAIDSILQAYIATYGLRVVNQVALTSFTDFQAFAISAYGQDFSTQEIERMLRAQFGINAWRSATIARTEVGKIASFTQVKVVEKASIETGAVFRKKWIPFIDERTRVSHASMESHPAIDMDSQFTVGGEKLDRPRDPNGSASNIINCRCTLDFVEV